MYLFCRILVIEDEDLFAQNLCDFLVRRRAEVRVALSAEEGLVAAAEFAPDVVLIDFTLPGMNGMEAFSCLKGARDTLLGILMTGHAVESLDAAARAVRIDHILSKPFPLADLERILVGMGFDLSRDSSEERCRVAGGDIADRCSRPDSPERPGGTASRVGFDEPRRRACREQAWKRTARKVESGGHDA